MITAVVSLDPPRRWAYLEAASVLAHFELGDIQPLGVELGEDPFEAAFLTEESDLTRDPSGKRVWTLNSPMRRRALTRLMESGRLDAALQANPNRDRDASPLQRMLTAYLKGKAPDPDIQGVDELRATLVVSEWLGQSLPQLRIPPLSEIGPRLDFQNYLGDFRSLAGPDFVGRLDELDLLRNHLTGGAAPLVIWAPGGMGKSAVIAKFILSRATLNPIGRFPIVYLDFDRSALDPDEPVTFLLDAFNQIAVQFPELRSVAEAHRTEWTERMANPNFREDRSVENDPTRRRSFRLKDRDWYLESFVTFVTSLRTQGRPLLFILDTFEEAQFRSRALVEDTLDLLERLRKRLPRFRAVLSGRREVVSSRYPCQNRELKQLDETAAANYLLKTQRVEPAVASVISRQLKRSPLILRIASQLLAAGEPIGESGFRNLDTGFFARLRGKSIESQLYSRFLDHIHDKEVQKLAHPGLVLRRITPDLIFEVLREPCRLDITTRDQAADLFRKLRGEGALVMDIGADAVEHLPDLRRLMIEDMMHDPTQNMVVVHRNAVEFYKARTGEEARAEELYHRLMLKPFDREAMESRWDDAAGNSLGRSIEEMPNDAQAYVAAKLDFEVSPEVWNEARQPDWEKHAARIGREHLSNGRYQFALDALRERTARLLASELYTIEADLLTLRARAAEGLALVEKALDEALVQRLSTAQMGALWRRRDNLSGAVVSGIAPADLARATEALVDAFNSEELAGLMRTRFGRELTPFVTAGEAYRQIVLAVVLASAAEAPPWFHELIAAARRSNPTNPRLAALGVAVGAGSAAVESELAHAADVSPRFSGVSTYHRTLGEIEGRVARLEIMEGSFTASATGLLVGPDLLLTSFSLFDRLARNYVRQSGPGRDTPRVDVRFDLEVVRQGVVRAGVEHSLHRDWLVAFSPSAEFPWPGRDRHLNFVLIRLDGSPGLDRRAGGLLRGWSELPGRAKPPASGESVVMVSYPAGEGLRTTTSPNGVVAVDPAAGLMWDVANTEAGSSGAPCFDVNLDLIAIRTLKGATRHEAVLTSAIAREIADAGVTLPGPPSAAASWPSAGDPLPAALAAVYEPRAFEAFLLRALQRRLRDYVPLNAAGIEIFFWLVEGAKRQGWLHNLLLAARAEFPFDPHLYDAAQTAGLTALSSTDVSAARQTLLDAGFVNLGGWSEALARLEQQICSIELRAPGGMLTARSVLIGADLALTDASVTWPILFGPAIPEQVKIRFDADGLPPASPITYGLGSPWRLDLERACDVLRIDPSAAMERGWPNAAHPDSYLPGRPVLLLQYSPELPLMLDGLPAGIVSVSDDEPTFRYLCPARRGAWAACFNERWELLGIGLAAETGLAECTAVTIRFVRSRADVPVNVTPS
jgi:hypothetical protein